MRERIRGDVYVVKSGGRQDLLVSVQECWACGHLLPIVVPGTEYECINGECPGYYLEVPSG